MTLLTQVDTVSGHYFNIEYRGNPLYPILLVVLLIAAFWWALKRRRKAK